MSASFFKSNMRITGGTIDDTEIDMNDRKITSVSDPTNPQDAVNLQFLESMVFKKLVSLTGTSFSIISSITRGAYYITIFPDESTGSVNGPAATFSISKSKAAKHMHCVRTTSSPGDITSEQLDIQWLPNSSLQLKKTNTGFDGDYCVVLHGTGY